MKKDNWGSVLVSRYFVIKGMDVRYFEICSLERFDCWIHVPIATRKTDDTLIE